ncbi:MAG: S46 family peptidase [Bacteroidales bacterium]|nr:S46 family peptidase [Bacteroidales bacterium]
MKRFALLTALLVAITPSLFADEGMWLVGGIDKGLMSKMRSAGLKLSAEEIFSENGASLSDAVVALDFMGTGSFISPEGLLITNHHVAYADIHSISTMEHNWLEDGFLARERSQEIPITGRRAFVLKKMLDVTEEVHYVQDSAAKTSKPALSRRLSYIMEKRYADAFPGCEISFESMWRGEKYYIMVYAVYNDLRLVAAPPACIGAFGGNVDNWEWPQHKGDFAIYRVYTAPDGTPAEYSPDNVPLCPEKYLTINAGGLRGGDYTMVMGFPGRTNRYNSSYAVEYAALSANPITVKAQGEIMEIMNSHMERKPETRLKYADSYFSISNVQELREGEMKALRRYGVPEICRLRERELQAWIDAAPERKSRWGSLLPDMDAAYRKVHDAKLQVLRFREYAIRGCESMTIATKLDSHIRTAVGKGNTDPEALVAPLTAEEAHKLYPDMDLALEKERFVHSIVRMDSEIGRAELGAAFNEMADRFGGDVEAMARWAWDHSFFSSPEAFIGFTSTEHPLSAYHSDPAMALLKSVSIADFNRSVTDIEEKYGKLSHYDAEYTHALYEMGLDKGIPQYPDANSTLRLTFGHVCPLHPSDARFVAEKSTSKGILEKYDPTDYEFNVNDDFLALLKEGDWGRWGDRKDGKMYVNFLSDNDITGGNSGSPVMDAKGRLVGLAFDGNKESLCSDAYFHPDYCKTVSVDIRYVLWILEKYLKADHLLSEMKIINQ